MTGVAQVKVMKAEPMLMLASEQFLGKAMFEMEETILQTLEGHLRAILGTLTVEEVYANREVFAQQVAIFAFFRIRVFLSSERKTFLNSAFDSILHITGH